jgi:hypothetical protein
VGTKRRKIPPNLKKELFKRWLDENKRDCLSQ